MGNVVETTSPYIDFHSSGNNVDYDVRVIATSGSSTVGTGILNIVATNAQVNSNNIWHAGNITFSNGINSNGYDTSANSKGVIRDANGNIAFNLAYGNLQGVASGNLPLTGGELTGTLKMKSGNKLEFETSSGNTRGFIMSSETNDEHLIIATSTNEDIVFKDGGTSGTVNLTIRGAENQTIVNGYLNCGTSVRTDTHSPFSVRIGSGNAPTSGAQGFFATAVLEKQSATWNRLRFDKSNVAQWGVASDPDDRFVISRLDSSFTGTPDDDNFVIATNGFVGIQTNNPQYQLQVNGTFAATSKSFVIDHPTKKDYQLVYGSLEGPEHGVYVRGKVTDGVIELPDYWSALVDEDTITVQLTAIGDSGNRWVIDVADNKITTGGGAAFYFVQAERKDIDKLTVEVEVIKEEE